MRDELYEDARRIVIETQSASIVLLQRRLRIPFSRAARLMDDLEIGEIVSAPTKGLAREVLRTGADR